MRTSSGVLARRRSRRQRESHSLNRNARADDGIRTRDTWLGKPVLYQLSYVRLRGADSTAAQDAPCCRNNPVDDETGTRESEAMANELHETARALVAERKGILAADESTGTIKKRFDSIGL